MKIWVILLVTTLVITGCSPSDSPTGSSTVAVTVKQTAAPETTTQTTTVVAVESTLAQPTPSPLPTASPTPTPTPKPTVTPTPTPTRKPTPTPTPKPTSTPTPKPTSTPVPAGFSYTTLSDAIKARITGKSYPADDSTAKIKYADLRYIKLLHYDFSGKVKEGELIVHARVAADIMAIFIKLYEAKYPLASVRLVDDFNADDRLSMTANNTSAFNYRVVSGTTSLSRHAYGAAIDLNPVFNPYVYKGEVSPANGAPYADRTKEFAGKIDHDDLCYKLFKARGWSWGGDWRYEKDYQHFFINF